MECEDGPPSPSSFEYGERYDERYAIVQHRVEVVCRGCALGKYTKTAFPSNDTRSKGVLNLIHSDLCGPMSFGSLTGFEYYITFIDDYSRKTWIYFLRSKKFEEVLKRFQEFKGSKTCIYFLWRTKYGGGLEYLD